jgi:hypothetical protein
MGTCGAASSVQSWPCCICGTANPMASDHCKQCDHSRYRLVDGSLHERHCLLFIGSPCDCEVGPTTDAVPYVTDLPALSPERISTVLGAIERIDRQSGIGEYTRVCRAALLEVQRQQGQPGHSALGLAAKSLAVLALQSERYGNDEDYQLAVDAVLALTREVVL